MKVTTVRFGADVWRLLEAEADRAGISVSQYIREAALARAAAGAAARGADPLALLGQIGAPTDLPAVPVEPGSPTAARYADELQSQARALMAQSQQAIRQADALIRWRDELTRGKRAEPASTEPQA